MSAWEKQKEELRQENDLLNRLDALEKQLDNEKMDPADLKTLIRAYKRKHNECSSYREQLSDLRVFLLQCYDEEDDYFDPTCYEQNGQSVYHSNAHWCKSLIEELTENLGEGMVYMPLKISKNDGL